MKLYIMENNIIFHITDISQIFTICPNIITWIQYNYTFTVVNLFWCYLYMVTFCVEDDPDVDSDDDDDNDFNIDNMVSGLTMMMTKTLVLKIMIMMTFV